ncbi:MAG: beta-N-acetylhexosaminidase [Alphaproteobacteria bacterium]
MVASSFFSSPLPFIVGLAGKTISPEEKKFFSTYPPFGFILFERNIASHQQLKSLTHQLKNWGQEHLGNDIFIFIDQEGGRVRRLKPPLVYDAPSMIHFNQCYQHNPENGKKAIKLYGALQGAELQNLGINVNCAPVLDIYFAKAHDIIGDRALSNNHEDIITLADNYLYGLNESGVLSVMKHIPGHGRAMVDSHHDLPSIKTDRAILEKSDFMPFRHFAKTIPFAMTAHMVYENWDNTPATLSKTIIKNVIRDHIGFNGLLITDDLSMKALSGDMAERGRAALLAGCDILLHCNGRLDEMKKLAQMLMDIFDEKKQMAFKKSYQNIANLYKLKKEKMRQLDEKKQADDYKTITRLLSCDTKTK